MIDAVDSIAMPLEVTNHKVGGEGVWEERDGESGGGGEGSSCVWF